ncbi:MAG: ribonuclease Y [Patescibacteria group bacterium]
MPEYIYWILLLLAGGLSYVFYTKSKNSQQSSLSLENSEHNSRTKELEDEISTLKAKLKSAYTREKYDEEIKETTERIREEKQQQLEELKVELKERFAEKEADLKTTITQKFELEAQAIVLKAQREAADRLLEVEKQEQENRTRLVALQEKIEAKEAALDEKISQIEAKREEIEQTKDKLRAIKADLEQARADLEDLKEKQEEEFKAKLAKIAKLPLEEAREMVVREAQEEMGNNLLKLQHKLLEAAEEDANFKARQIVSLAIQRCSSEVANEFTLTTIKLADDDIKGRIIGKQGRNIQWLEKTLGVEIVIDETPEIVTISGFNSIRRHVAKRTLEMLLDDGRIHPASIEDFYKKAQAEVAEEIAQAGKWAVEELGIYDFPPKLVRIIGRLKFRTSYGQNMLKHSVEMAKLAELLAIELNKHFPHREPINIDIVKKGALLHDIGKALDQEIEGNHVDLGEKVCDTFGLDWKIRKCVSSHHNEEYDDPRGFCIEAVIVDACDNISGGRMGARKETAEAYFQRIESLEKIAETTPGITKSWIMRGCRELWIFFDTEKVTPAKMHEITTEVANRVQTEAKYPGEIKVIGFWEDRAIEWAA